jgi:hypothetical protein
MVGDYDRSVDQRTKFKSEAKSKKPRWRMMSESGKHFCPNPFCKKEKLADGKEKCPECGAYVYELNAKELAKLLQQKRSLPETRSSDREAKEILFSDEKGILFSDEMTDEEIRTLILKDMHNLATHEADRAIDGSGFKALMDQNKIIIRQNELIIRELKRLAIDRSKT